MNGSVLIDTEPVRQFALDTATIIVLLSFILLVLVLLLMDKISKRYDMSKKDIFLGLLTQVPILGGIVLFKKLVEIEKKVEVIDNGRSKD